MSIQNFEVKKLLAFKMISSLFSNKPVKIKGKVNSGSEYKVHTDDRKVIGIIDFIKMNNSEIEILDYKTGSIYDFNLPNNVKEEYLVQLKLYAAIYNSMHRIWPTKLTLIGLNDEINSIDVIESECSSLLEDAITTLNEINELIEAGLSAKDFAQPTQNTCRFCLFRPACDQYWKVRTNDGTWPNDVFGKVVNMTTLENGYLRIKIETASGEIVIRGLSKERHKFLEDTKDKVIFCNLWNDITEGQFIEQKLTTGYNIED